jgi:hypothetical protein
MKLGITWGQELGRPECPYLRRWVLNFHFFSIRLHRWRSSDDHRNFHDHPWWFLTLVMFGSYIDVSPYGREAMRPGRVRFRPALHRHTVEVAPGGCWTIRIPARQDRRRGFWVKGKPMKANKYFLEIGHHPCAE